MAKARSTMPAISARAFSSVGVDAAKHPVTVCVCVCVYVRTVELNLTGSIMKALDSNGQRPTAHASRNETGPGELLHERKHIQSALGSTRNYFCSAFHLLPPEACRRRRGDGR